MINPKTIVLIDDNGGAAQSGEEDLRDIFPQADIFTFYKSTHLEQALDEGVVPDILITDCTDGHFGEKFGLTNARILVEWCQKNRPDEPLPAILFQSADEERALENAGRLKDHYGAGVLSDGFNDMEVNLAAELARGDSLCLGLKHTQAFRVFLRDHCGITLPISQAELTAYTLEKQTYTPDEIVDLAFNGDFERDKALTLVQAEATNRAKHMFLPGVKQSSHGDWVDISPLRMHFERAAGMSANGYAAFSVTDIEKLAKEGKKAVLFTTHYTPDFIPLLGKIAGLVMIDYSGSGHMQLLLDAHGVAGALGSQDLREHYPFLRDEHGKNIQYARSIEGRGKNRTFRDVYAPVMAMANAHRHTHMQKKDGMLDVSNWEEDLNKVPELHIEASTLQTSDVIADGQKQRLSVANIKAGDAVCIGISNAGTYLWPMHLEASEPDGNFMDEWVPKVGHLLKHWHDDNGLPHLKFKAIIDHPDQARLLDDYAEGIGLARTEHFVLADQTQLKALKDLLLEQDEAALRVIQKSLTRDLEHLFWHGNVRNPLRIRLLDLPPQEGFSGAERARLGACYGDADIRGVQLAMQVPALYEAQLKGIFAGMRARMSEGGDITPDYGLEIMVPTVRNGEELRFVKALAAKAAQEYGFTSNDYAFGAMLETKEACQNIADIAKDSDFLSIGSNDLTAEILDCARDDFEKRHKIMCAQHQGKDPFVTLYPQVGEAIFEAASKARAIKPDMPIDLCGAHGCDLVSLERLRGLPLNAVSVPPIAHHLQGLRLLYQYATFDKLRAQQAKAAPALRSKPS